MSSDSEDDFYGNITERLQKEKDKFQEDKTETAHLFDDSTELDEIVKNNKLPLKKNRKSAKSALEESAGCSKNDFPDVSVDNSETQTTKRVTRSRARKSNVDASLEVDLPPTKAKRQKSNASVLSSVSETSIEEASTSRGRGRGRSRGRGTPRGRGAQRGRKRRSRVWTSGFDRSDVISQFLAALMCAPNRHDSWDPSIPTYSVGNTAEYPDESHEQPLFSKNNQKKPDDVVVVEEENDDDNEELSVKVYWQSSEFFKFTIRRFQKLTQIFEYFAKKENVSHDKLLFMYNEKILTPNDSPDSIEYSIVKFIDGGIVSQGVTDLVMKSNEKIKGGITIKFQCQHLKKPFEITVRPDDKFSNAMMQCSEHLEKPLEKLKFEFDGDSISGKSTPRELEFEGGECIDVRILS